MAANEVGDAQRRIAWERAKPPAHEEYRDATGERFYRIVMAIYKKMTQGRDTLEVLTTSQKLAHRIAREVENSFNGQAHYSWSDDDGASLAIVKVASSGAKVKKSR